MINPKESKSPEKMLFIGLSPCWKKTETLSYSEKQSLNPGERAQLTDRVRETNPGCQEIRETESWKPRSAN
jgi:hypothetical protein